MNSSLKVKIFGAKHALVIKILLGMALLFSISSVAFLLKRPIFLPPGSKLPTVLYSSLRTDADVQRGVNTHVFLPDEDGTPIDGASELLTGKSIRFLLAAKSDGLQEVDFFTAPYQGEKTARVSASIYEYSTKKTWSGDKDNLRLIHSDSVMIATSPGVQRHVFAFPRQDSSYRRRFVVELSSSDKTSVRICTKKTLERNLNYYVHDLPVAGCVYFWDGYGRKRFSLKNRPILLGSFDFIVQHAFSRIPPNPRQILLENLPRAFFILLLMMGSLAAPYLACRFVVWQAAASKMEAAKVGRTKNLSFFLGTAVYLGPFLYIVHWFSTHDIWNTNIAYGNSVYVFHTIFRILFIFYFSWIIYSVGAWLMGLLEKNGRQLSLAYLDRIIVAFFFGAAGLHIVMFVLGYMNAYYRNTALLLSVLILLLSYGNLRAFAREGFVKIADLIGESDSCERRAYFMLGSALIFVSTILFLVIGLYTNDGDYITHYGNFYAEVIRSHGIWPNGWWYQYFYSKGAGLFFLSMLLTDKMSPPIVSYIFIMASCLMMFALMKRISKDSRWPLIAIFYYISVLIANYTIPYRMHVVSGVMLIAVIWILAIAKNDNPKAAITWRVIGSLIMLGLVIVAPTVSIYALGAVGLYALASIVRKQWGQMNLYTTWMVAGGVSLAGILLVNYLTTGLFEGTPFRLWLGLWDQARSIRWVSPYMLYYVSELIGPDMGRIIIPGQVSLNASMIQLLSEALRFNYIAPLFLTWFFVPGVIALAFLAIKKKADLSVLPFIAKDFRVGYNAMINDYGLIETIKNWIDENNIEGYLFLFSASSFSKMAIQQLYEHSDRNTYIDVGTTLNPFMNMRLDRTYLKSFWLGAKGSDLNKICIW